MSRRVIKLFFAWQLDKEKAYLEDMGLKGYKLKRVRFGGYEFEQIEPTKLIYQFDFRSLSKKREQEYLSYFDEWEYIDRLGGWYYFVSDAENKEVNLSIFSDNKSRSDIYKRLSILIAIFGFPLYYQLIFLYPNMNPSEFEFPKFYFFFRFVVIIFMFIHIFVMLKLLTVYKKLKDSIVD